MFDNRTESFTLLDEFTVAGGVIGNGTAEFRFGSGSGWVTCTYQGQASTSEPETEAELTQGSILGFQGCTDGLPADAERTATEFELQVNPIPNYPVSVQPPISRPSVCDDTFELLTPEQTRQMRDGFDWSEATRVEPFDSDDRPAL